MPFDNCPSLSQETLPSVRNWARRRMAASEWTAKRMREVLHDLDAAERVLRLLQAHTISEDDVAQLLTFCPENPFMAGSTKSFIWEAMNGSRETWLRSDRIQSLAAGIKGESLKLSTIRSSLSHMRRANVVVRRGRLLALASRAEDFASAERGVEAKDQPPLVDLGAMTLEQLDAVI